MSGSWIALAIVGWFVVSFLAGPLVGMWLRRHPPRDCGLGQDEERSRSAGG